ncbi:MAG: 16S rRNA (cytidine(1402)-2'-O)-methyltransferase [Lentisphaerae bacterium]|nr:16S rRNA (cytidine(1402)-2'-O)-methyltransferase [Lentisphaerota bacterium]
MLTLVATPIGNLEDVSARALRVLREADVLACEDTRRTRALLSRHAIPAPRALVSYREQNERRMAERLVREAAAGRRVAVCSDGGYPGISDPGYRVIALAIERGVPFEVAPGASAVPVALLLSGLPPASYTFKGYPPRKPGPRRRFFEAERESPHTLICFESPYRTGKTLDAALEALGDRRAAVCIELTKRFERIARGTLSALAAEFAGQRIRGEVTLVIEGSR